MKLAVSPHLANWPTPRKLAVGYAIAIAALVVNAIVTFWNLNSIRNTWDTLAAGSDFVRGVDSVLSILKDAETGQRGYLLTGDERYLEPYTRSHAVILEQIDRLRALAGAAGSRQEHLSAVAEASAAKLAELQQTITLRRQAGFEAALAVVKTDRGKAAMDRIRGELATIRADEDATRDALRDRLQTALNRTMISFTFASGLALALLFGVHLLSERSREETRQRAAWLSTTLRSIGDAVIATDGGGRVSFMNGVAETLTGWPQAEAAGRPLEDVFRIINEETRSAVENPVTKALREGAIVGLANHTVLIARDDTEYAIDDAAAPIRADGSDKQGVVLIFHDIGDRRKLERQLHDRTTRLVEADHRKDEFLAMLAHELRNPLACISNAVQLLRTPEAAEHAEWSTEVIERQVKHLGRLIDDLLDVSRITRGKIELRKERIDASPVIESALEAVRPLIQERKHELAVSFTPGTLWCEADPTRLEQMLINLLANAAKYTEAGGHIRLTARNDGDHITFQVKDDGVGIPSEKLSEMFELFAQGDRTIARSEGGLGIGLTIVKRIAELHGGTATASSQGPGLGSEFTVTLPAIPRPAPEDAVTPATRPKRGRYARILIIDDNVDTAHGLARLLRLLGHDIRTAHDGQAAIAEALAFRPEFILLDIGLPGMDGYQVARRLRHHQECHDTVIIAISGYGQEEDRLRSQEAGVNYHLVKPVDYDALVTLIG
jgi:PAS domain S-box-containing protein